MIRFVETIKKIVRFVFLAPVALCSLIVLFLWGYFGYKASQPMQVGAAQQIAPGITFNEFMADRKELYQEVDAKTGKGFCMARYKVGLPFASLNTGLGVLAAHFKFKDAAWGRNMWFGIFPPDEILYGFLPDAVWWEVENWNWYFAQNHAACNPRPVRRPQAGQ